MVAGATVATMMGEDFGSSITGALLGQIPKATLYLRKPENGLKGQELLDTLTTIKTVSAQAQNLLSDSISADRKETKKTIEAMKAQGFIPVKVPYNPKSIRFQSYNGRITSGGIGSEQGMGTQTQMQMQATTNLSFQLIFTDISLKDAFMWEKFRLSAKDLIDTGFEIARISKGKIHTVKNEVEGLVGMMCNPVTRRVLFSWGDMAYQGEVTSIDANYTMFSPDGHPIMATVDMTIQQIADNNDNIKEDEAYWGHAFDRLFKDGKDLVNKVDGQSIAQSMSSVLNIKI